MLGDDLEPQQLLLGSVQLLHQLVHAVARHGAQAGLAQPDDIVEHCGRARLLFGAPPPGVLDEVDGSQVPGIPVRQLGLLQPGDVGRLGPPPCHDAFCIADIILQYLLEGDETLNRQACRLGLLDFCFTSPQPFLGKSTPGERLGLGKSQLSAFLQTDLSWNDMTPLALFRWVMVPISAP